MNKISICYYRTKIGELLLGEYQNKICLLDFRHRKMRSTVDKRIQQGLQAEYTVEETPLLQGLKSEINAYLAAEIRKFSLPIFTVGTEFQKRVWQVLLQIPYGKVITYADLAEKVENQTAVRAVATANGANAMSLIIPCHRVIGSDGELRGYAGGLKVKQRLLNLESRQAVLDI